MAEVMILGFVDNRNKRIVDSPLSVTWDHTAVVDTETSVCLGREFY